MTAAEVDRPAPARPVPVLAGRPQQVTQTTAVEQARAVAEVQAAVIVAQQMPRDVDRALAEMRDVCSRLALANRAFYSVPNRGNGPSVHLARELIRIWGNADYGVKELRRDDAAGESEVMASAWDQQTNVRSVRSFIVPHARMKNGQRQPLTDLGDIYLSNQNVGARAVRECIFTILPTWFTEEAQDLCRETLERGDGKPLEQRIADAVTVFDKLGVAVDRIEQKFGRRRGQWTAQDVAQLAVFYTDITRDGIASDELFPKRRVTGDEIHANADLAKQRASESTETPPQAVTPVAPAEGTTSDAGGAVGPVSPASEEPPSTDVPECIGCGKPVRHSPAVCPGSEQLDERLDGEGN